MNPFFNNRSIESGKQLGYNRKYHAQKIQWKKGERMNKKPYLIFDIDDTLYSQMQPLLDACEGCLGRKLDDPERFYRIFCKRSGEMFLFSESGQVSIEQSRICRITNTMKDM